MSELQLVDSFPIWKAVLWCVYPIAVLVLVELIARSLPDDDDDGIPDNVDRCVNTKPGVEVLPMGEDFQGCDADPRSDYLIGLAGLLIILSVVLIVRIRKKERAQRERLREEDYNA